MVLLALGVNFKTATLPLREKMAACVHDTESVLSKLQETHLVSEAVLLSTCNRTELYVKTKEPDKIRSWFAHHFALNELELNTVVYEYVGLQATCHLMQVACGLNSMILGEVQILGQIKKAFHIAKEAGCLGKYLNRLFEKCFFVAKMVRSQTDIGFNPVSVASATIKLAGRIFSDLQQSTILLIGAGDLIRLCAEHLKRTGVKKILIANRTFSKAENLGQRMGGEAMPLEALPHRLWEADVVISGTGSVLPLVGKGMVEAALKKRKHRPMLMMDLALPRDIESQVGSLDNVYLYCLDDLQRMVAENRQLREACVKEAESMIQQESEQFMSWALAQDKLKTLKAFRHKVENLREVLLEEAVRQLRVGKDPEEVLRRFGYRLFNRLIHLPTERLRRAGFANEIPLLETTQELFDLKNEILHS